MRPKPIIRSKTPVPNWVAKKCSRCGKTFWALPSKAGVLHFCSKDCRCPGVKERLIAGIEKINGHWLWIGACGNHGYGNIKDDQGNQWRTHRLAYTLFVGPIPNGLDVLHKRCCVGHPNCCAPDHLYVGTVQQNADDRVACGRQHDARGEKCPTHKLQTEQVNEIRTLRWTVRAQILADRFGVSKDYIWAIWLNITWKHLPQCPPKPVDWKQPRG